MLLGAHVSIREGVRLAPGRGEALGCETIQIFSKNQRQWRAKPLEEEEARAFRKAVRETGMRGVMIHDSYLINLADPEGENLEKSRGAFVEELERAQRLGVSYLVFHPGAHKGAGEEAGLARIAESLDACAERAEAPDVVMCLEVTAGQGTALGYRFEQLRTIREAVRDPKRVGYCLDTCHLFAAGYDLRDAEGYEAVMHHVEVVLGVDNVKAFHLNDAKRELGSHVDRHEEIGKGEIGLEGFRMLVNDPRFREAPGALEVPGEEKEYRANLELLKGLRES